MKKKTTLLLSFVGGNDPRSRSGEYGSLFSILNHLQGQPELNLASIHLLYTKDFKDNLERCKQEIKAVKPKIKVTQKQLNVTDVLSQNQIKKEILSSYKSITTKTKFDHIVLNGTSGTPAMKTVSQSMVVVGLIQADIYEARDPGKKSKSQKLVFRTDLEFLVEEFLRNQLFTLIKKKQYSAALSFLHDPKESKAKQIFSLLKYGHALSSFDFKNAQEQLNKDCPGNLQSHRAILDSLNTAPTNAKEFQSREKNRLIALYWNLQLKAQKQEWVDYLGRLYRLWEALSEYAARQIYLGFELGWQEGGSKKKRNQGIIDHFRKQQLEHYPTQKADKLKEKLFKNLEKQEPNLTQALNKQDYQLTLLDYVADNLLISDQRFSRFNWMKLIGYVSEYLSKANDNTEIKTLLNTPLIVDTLLNNFRNQTIIAHGYDGFSMFESVQIEEVETCIKRLFTLLRIDIESDPFEQINKELYLLLGVPKNVD